MVAFYGSPPKFPLIQPLWPFAVCNSGTSAQHMKVHIASNDTAISLLHTLNKTVDDIQTKIETILSEQYTITQTVKEAVEAGKAAAAAANTSTGSSQSISEYFNYLFLWCESEQNFS